jgi:hypothetical protein
MPKLRLAIILPILMACTFVVVIRWQRHVDVQLPPKREYPSVSSVTSAYLGLNAPAVLFEAACKVILPIDRLNQPPSSLFGIGIGQLLFFAGVVVLWFTVGLSLDHRSDRQTSAHTKMTVWRMVGAWLLLIFAIVLFGGAVFLMKHRPSGSPVGDILQAILWLGWSLLLTCVSGTKILRRFIAHHESQGTA